MKQFNSQNHTDKNGYHFSTVNGDENGVRTYTLQNGLTVYLAQNFDAPRIQTYIAVRTGSNNDPADNTGLAHYLEHMMFKGTSKIGTSDWNKEKVLLTQISNLFEAHKTEKNPEKKTEIYRRIDELSLQASEYTIANEYDKVISSIGATGTNAHTWLDETVYKNNIPSNALEKWLKIEKERFTEIVLRLFHTELESVYEEFNRAQDNDARLVNYALMELLFPAHPNGQHTTLGRAEHLKNPSMVAIHKYFEEYYVPNNYAMVLVGDLDFDKTITLVDAYFGQFKNKELPEKTEIKEKPITQIINRTVKSPTIPRVQIAWRTNSYGTKEAMLADIVANILSNKGEAGLLDLNINQEQKALWAQAFSVAFKDYGYISAVIVPKEGQTLGEGVEMLIEQIEHIKKGDFPDWLIPAVLSDFRLQRIKSWETADGLATTLYDTYIKGRTWEQEVNEMNEYAKISKQEVIRFANDFFKENYVAVYKEKGENENLIRVDNPKITPIKLNREAQSEFLKEILSEELPELQPEFIDYQKEIQTTNLRGKKVSFVKNKYNDLAQIHYIFPFGSDHDAELALATQALQYLGTSLFTPEQLRQEFYKIGITNDFKTVAGELTISLSGLEENLQKGAELLQHWLGEVQPDQQIFRNFVRTYLESRDAAKKDKARIMTALTNFAKFGRNSRFTDVISKKRLLEMHVEDLTDKMRRLFSYPYEIFFYGKDFESFRKYSEPLIKPETFPIPPKRIYPEPNTEGTVYFTNYDMVQMEMGRVAKARDVNPADFGKINVFNEYFGRGLSSIVFQEIRESKSLAYSSYVIYQANPELHHPDYISAYIGTQPDKLMTAVEALDTLMSQLPQVPLQFENAKNTALKQIEAGRIVRTNIYFNLRNLEKLGIHHDFRKEMYAEIKNLDLQSLTHFYNAEVRPLRFNTAIIGRKENLDMHAVEKMGEFCELTLEEIFGF